MKREPTSINTTIPALTSFLPSQTGAKSQTPLPYTGNPWKLMIEDFILCFSKWNSMLGIFLPIQFNRKTGDPFGELYPSFTNLNCLMLQVILTVSELIFMFTIPLLLIVPVAWLGLYIGGFFLFKYGLCYILNGNKLTLEPSKEIIEKFTGHENEYWIFLNGVSVGKVWLQANIDRLSLTFGRVVHGVLNSTDGVLFDLLQCLVQRNFTYATSDVRESYVQLKNALYDKDITKVVFILHSQGGIEGGLIIDWLLAEVPQDHLSKLEVYTFGNAANHFNNPNRTSGTSTKESYLAHTSPTYADLAIGHMEHYANVGDYVAQVGVLHYGLNPKLVNRFMGRIFQSPYSGHLLNEHYLHFMFPLDKSNTRCLDSNAFMNMSIDIFDTGDMDNRKTPEQSIQSLKDDSSDDDEGPKQVTEVAFIGDAGASTAPVEVKTKAITEDVNGKKTTYKVKNLSRLWLYRNGGSPPDELMKKSGTF